MRWALWSLGVFGLSACCDTSRGVDLLLDLRTDLVAGAEFREVRTERFDQIPAPEQVADGAALATRRALLGEDFVRGQRIAIFRGLRPGRYAVRVRLIGSDGEPTQQRIVLISLKKTSVFTVVVTRDCRGVICPEAGDDPRHTECLGGQCVLPECTPETLEFCPSFSCEVGVTCTATAACAQPQCTGEQICLREGGGSSCGAGRYCNPDVGCEPLPEETDGGVTSSDAGPTDGSTSPPSWGRWVATQELPDCPPGQLLLVNTTEDELSAGTDVSDPTQAGTTLSLAEAIFIATNTSGPHVVQFDPTVFPVDSPATIAITPERRFPLANVVNTCIDGRNRGVIVAWNPVGTCSDCIWRLGSGALQMGLTLLGMPDWLVITGGAQVAGCRIGTDGEQVYADGSPAPLQVLTGGTIGPANVIHGDVGWGVAIQSGSPQIQGNYFGYDPVTGNPLACSNGLISFSTATEPTQVTDNVFHCRSTGETPTRAARIAFSGNFFGVDANGVALPQPRGFSWKAVGNITFGPDNVVTGATNAAVSWSTGAQVLVTRNRIFSNAEGIVPSGTAPSPPTIATAQTSGANGTCPEDGLVELFTDDQDQGENFVAQVSCTTAGGWTHAGLLPAGRNLTATLTARSETSAFSSPVSIP